MLKGNLSSFSLGEIFQSLAINNHTGTLKITTREGVSKCIYFSRGEISLFSAGSQEALRIGEILMRQMKLAPDDLHNALEEQKQTGELLGKVLIRKGVISKDDIRLALETKIREEIYDLFLLTEAEFEFYINHLPEETFDPLQKNTRIAINTSAVIMEGLRRVDEWRLIQRRIKTFDEIFVRVKSSVPEPLEEAGADLYQKLDGKTPVAELFATYHGSRFDCSKSLCELVESGRVRPINLPEAIAGGERVLKEGNVKQALVFYRFADQLDPAQPQVLKALASCLAQVDKEEESAAVQRRAIRLYFEREMHREALELGERFLESRQETEPEIAEIVFRTALILGRPTTARTAGNQLLSAALARGDFVKAQEVLEELCALSPKDLNLRIELAETYSRGGDKSRAISHLEGVSAELNSKKKHKELIKVLLLILEMDPERMEIQQRVQKLLALQAKWDKRKKQRVTIVGLVAILLILASLLPFLYELKARELYSHAQRLEEISLVSNNFAKAKAAYEEVLKSYSFSSRASVARLALDRVSTFERLKLESLDGEKATAERHQYQKLKALREALPDLLKEAKRFEEAGDIQRAFDIYTRISSEFSEVPGARNVLFPLLLTTNPKGALVEINGAIQGTTPLVLRAQKGHEVTLTLSRSGCQPMVEKVYGGEKWKVHLSLDRRPIGEIKVSGPLQQPLDARGERIFFPSRDGYLYAVTPAKKEVSWHRKVGEFGDLVSEIASTPKEILIGNVAGEVLAISRENGKARWKARLGAAVLAPPAVSPDGRWVAAATVDGEVSIFDLKTGELRGRFLAEDEVTAAPAFIANLVLVGSADHRLYELTVPGAVPQGAVELRSPITAGLTPGADSVYFATADGSVHRYSAAERRVVWSRSLGAEVTGAPVASPERVFLGTAAGEVAALDAARGEVSWTLKVSVGRVGRLTLGRGRLFVGAESGDLVAIIPATGTRDWAYKADSAIAAPPLLAFGRLFVPCSNGKILVMELME